VKLLIHSEDELCQTKLFTRLWPTNRTHHYLHYLDPVPYLEKLMDAYESLYSVRRDVGIGYISKYCEHQTHLRVNGEELGGENRHPLTDKAADLISRTLWKLEQIKLESTDAEE